MVVMAEIHVPEYLLDIDFCCIIHDNSIRPIDRQFQ